MSVTPTATCETARIGIAPSCPLLEYCREAATATAMTSTIRRHRAAEKPDPDRAGEVGWVGRFDALGIDPRDQRARRCPLLPRCGIKRVPKDRLEPHRGGMAG